MQIFQVKRTSRLLHFTLSVVILLSMHSCTDGELFYRYRSIDHAIWDRNKVLLFIDDSLQLPHNQLLEVSLEIISNNSYPYRDLRLLLEHNLTDPLFASDTIHIMLADQNGQHLGNSVGSLYQLSTPWLLFKCTDSCSLRISVSHLMTDNPLKGIERIGIVVEPANKAM